MSVAGGSVRGVNRTDRLYALVEELRAVAPRPRSARQLAGRYEVSTRTIERDILALQESGVPVYAETGRRGGYVIDKALNAPAAELHRGGDGRDGGVPGRGGGHAVRLARCAARCARCSRPPRPRRPRRRADGPGPADRDGGGRRGGRGAPRGSAVAPLAIQEAITARHVLRLRLPGPARRRDRPRRGTGGVRRDAGALVPGGLVPAAAGAAGPSAWTGSSPRPTPASPRPTARTRDLDVDIPDALVRRPDLAG